MVMKFSCKNPALFQMKDLLQLSREAVKFHSRITIRKGKTLADPKRFIEMVPLLEEKGRDLEITAEGPDAHDAVMALHVLAAPTLV